MLTIATLVDKNEDFIQWQYNSMRHFVKDNSKYIVFNNSRDSERRVRIHEICEKSGIECISIYVNYKLDSSKIHAEALNEAWRNYLSSLSGTLMFLDSDMFFINIEITLKLDICGQGYSS